MTAALPRQRWESEPAYQDRLAAWDGTKKKRRLQPTLTTSQHQRGGEMLTPTISPAATDAGEGVEFDENDGSPERAGALRAREVVNVQNILVIGGRGLVYIDAREEHLKPDAARQLAAKLIELADRAEKEAS